METTTCPACRSVNPASTVACFNCGNRIGQGQAAWMSSHGSSSDPVVAVPSLPSPPGTLVTPSSVNPAARRSSLPMTLALVVAAIAVAGAVMLIRGRSSALPETLAGHARSRSEEVQRIEEVLAETQIAGLRMEVAVYGDLVDRPAAMLIVFRGDVEELSAGSSEQFFQGFGSQVVSTGGGSIDLANAARATVAGVDYLCAPFQGTTSTGFGQSVGGTMCVFRGDVIGMTMFVAGAPSPDVALTFTQNAYADLS